MMTERKLTVRPARTDETERVIGFYYALIDAMQHSPFNPAWKKDIYPTREDLAAAIEAGTLYLGEQGGEIAAAMILNDAYNEGYDAAAWAVDAKPEDIRVIHLLGVSSRFAGQGLAKEMARFAAETARAAGASVIRLDVLEGNLPAEKAYIAVGFSYRGTLQLFYEDTGWTNFRLFELVL